MNKNEILNAHNFRYACKEFDKSKVIDKDDFNTILEVGRLSPSSIGMEPWKFLIVQNPELREDIKPVCGGAKGQLETASHFIIILAKKTLTDEYANYILNDIKNASEEVVSKIQSYLKVFRTYSEEALFNWTSKQTYIVMANMMTCAAQMKIDSCPIEGFDKNEVEKILSSKGILNTEEFGVSCMVAFGYRNSQYSEPKARQPLDKITEWI